MAIEMSSDSAICFNCGTKYGRRKGYFQVSYSATHKGIGYLPICKPCVEKMYNSYLSQCNDAKLAVRQICRKFDLYWDESVFNEALNKATSRSVISRYLTRLSTNKLAGKSYDDTLEAEGMLWNFTPSPEDIPESPEKDIAIQDDSDVVEIPEEIIAFWGSGYSNEMYKELEQRRRYWMSNLPENTNVTIGMEAIIRQICNLEILIAKDSASGKPIEKSVNSLNTLLGSLNIKPTQLKEDGDAELDKMPLGVGIHMWENYRPLPATPPEQRDVSGRIKSLTTWFLGHTCHMLGIKNSYCKMYEEAMDKYRVERPEFEDEDEDDFLSDVFGSSEEEP